MAHGGATPEFTSNVFARSIDSAHHAGRPELILCFVAEKVLGLPKSY